MGVSGLDDAGLVQGVLFDKEELARRRRVDVVADQIRERFGAGLCGRTVDRTSAGNPP